MNWITIENRRTILTKMLIGFLSLSHKVPKIKAPKPDSANYRVCKWTLLGGSSDYELIQ